MIEKYPNSVSRYVEGLQTMPKRKIREIAHELTEEGKFGYSAYLIKKDGNILTVEKDNFY